tara:strand:+ start:107 stop:319 length:213 start_codon:yes stop_codon:yes gene_type:complete
MDFKTFMIETIYPTLKKQIDDINDKILELDAEKDKEFLMYLRKLRDNELMRIYVLVDYYSLKFIEPFEQP